MLGTRTMIKVGDGQAGVSSCAARANGLLCSGTASDWKWKGNFGPLEQGGSGKASQGSRVGKNPSEFEDRIGFDSESMGGKWQVALRSLPILCVSHAPLNLPSGAALPTGIHSPFYIAFNSANKNPAHSAVGLAFKHLPAAGLHWGTTSQSVQHKLGSDQ